METDLFVLGSHPPVLRRLFASAEKRDEIVHGFDELLRGCRRRAHTAPSSRP